MHYIQNGFEGMRMSCQRDQALAWLVDNIRVYIRVGVSGYLGNNYYPGFEEFGCIRISGYLADILPQTVSRKIILKVRF